MRAQSIIDYSSWVLFLTSKVRLLFIMQDHGQLKMFCVDTHFSVLIVLNKIYLCNAAIWTYKHILKFYNGW